MAAVDLLTRDDLAEVLAELRRLRAEVHRLSTARAEAGVSMAEAAAAWGVSQRTVRRWVRSGQVQASRVGSTVRVRLDAMPPGE